jgi:crotonobetainyl-CoA:carnitine CoA-transferase CaiB-like acyl-CoA transferase
VDHPVLGSVAMQNVIAKLSETPGRIRHPGPEIGEHNTEVFEQDLGLSHEELDRLERLGVVRAGAPAP